MAQSVSNGSAGGHKQAGSSFQSTGTQARSNASAGGKQGNSTSAGGHRAMEQDKSNGSQTAGGKSMPDIKPGAGAAGGKADKVGGPKGPLTPTLKPNLAAAKFVSQKHDVKAGGDTTDPWRGGGSEPVVDKDNKTKGMGPVTNETKHKMDETKAGAIKKVGSDAKMRITSSPNSTRALDTASVGKSAAEKLYPSLKQGRKAP